MPQRVNLSLLLFCIVLWYSGTAYDLAAQNDPAIDSILNVLPTLKEDTIKVNALITLSKHFLSVSDYTKVSEYIDQECILASTLSYQKGIAICNTHRGLVSYHQGQYPEALTYISNSLKISKDIKFQKGIADNYSNLGMVYSVQGDFEKAIENYMASLDARDENDKRGKSAAYNNLGIVYFQQGDYANALTQYLASLKIDEELGEKMDIAFSNNNVGTFYEHQKNHPEALKYYFAANKLCQDVGNKECIAGTYNNIAGVYRDQGNYTEALKHYAFALEMFDETGNQRQVAETSGNIGLLYYRQKQYALSQQYLQSSLSKNQEIGNQSGIAVDYANLGELYMATGKLQQARTYFEDAIRISTQIGIVKSTRDSYLSLSHLDSLMGNYADALKHFKLYAFYKDSLTNETNVETVAEIQKKYESEKKDKEIVRLEKEQEIHTLNLKRQTLLKNYLIAGLVLIAVLSFFVYRYYITRQQLKLQTLRNKIASDLHDDVGSTLSSISMFSEMAQEQSREVIPLLDTISESSHKMLDAMADIVWTINPENDQFEKIILRMRNFAYELLGAKKIDFEFLATDEVTGIKLPMEVRKNLYLIFKEATNNMVKYSEASKASFSVKEEKGFLTMLIRDNGKGFDTRTSTEGNGIRNMHKRAKEIGAKFFVNSTPGEGTMVQLKIAV